MNNEDENFAYAVEETARKHGPPPKIGTFTPKLGDIARDEDGKLKCWVGDRWVG